MDPKTRRGREERRRVPTRARLLKRNQAKQKKNSEGTRKSKKDKKSKKGSGEGSEKESKSKRWKKKKDIPKPSNSDIANLVESLPAELKKIKVTNDASVFLISFFFIAYIN